MTPTTIDSSAPFDAITGMAWRNNEAEIDRKKSNDARYSKYALICHNQLLSTDSGRVDPTASNFVPGVSGWPSMPFEVRMGDVSGWHYVEDGQDGPRLLNELDPVNYHVQPVPADYHLTAAQKMASLPQGVIDVGRQEGGAIYDVGPNDTWPAGIPAPAKDGHTYIKFSWAGLGYKYQMLS